MNEKDQNSKLHCGIVYHFFALYRFPVFKELIKNESIRFTFLSAERSGNNIKTIDPQIATNGVEGMPFRWFFLKNKWYKQEKILWQSGLLKQIRNQSFDVIIFLGNPYYLSTWLAAIYCRLKGIRVIFWTHGVAHEEQGIKWVIRKSFYGLADKLLLYGHKAEEYLITRGFNPEQLRVIYNSENYHEQLRYRDHVDASQRTSLRNALFKFPEHPVLIFVGRLQSVKRLDLIIEASAHLHRQIFPVNMLFVGNGEDLPLLKSLVKEHNLGEYTNFFGPCYVPQQISELFQIADLCVSPGEVGLTAINALGNGTPVITHDDFNHQMPEYEAITPGFNGEFFKRNSATDLASSIKKWLHDHREIPVEEIRKACYKIVDDRYNPIHQAKLIVQTLKDHDKKHDS